MDLSRLSLEDFIAYAKDVRWVKPPPIALYLLKETNLMKGDMYDN